VNISIKTQATSNFSKVKNKIKIKFIFVDNKKIPKLGISFSGRDGAAAAVISPRP
jgi:hypothetical protein